MYQYYNAHPKDLKVRDCVKRAISKALNKDYMEVQRELNTLKRELGESKYNHKKVWTTYLNNIGALKIPFPAQKGKSRMNGYTFVKEHKKGTYILSMAGHLTVCIDGVIYDTWDCREKCVYTAYKIVKTDENINIFQESNNNNDVVEKNYLVVCLINSSSETIGTVASTEEEAKNNIKKHYKNKGIIFVSVNEYKVIK